MSWKVNPGTINSLICPYFHFKGYCSKLEETCTADKCPIKEDTKKGDD